MLVNIFFVETPESVKLYETIEVDNEKIADLVIESLNQTIGTVNEDKEVPIVESFGYGYFYWEKVEVKTLKDLSKKISLNPVEIVIEFIKFGEDNESLIQFHPMHTKPEYEIDINEIKIKYKTGWGINKNNTSLSVKFYISMDEYLIMTKEEIIQKAINLAKKDYSKELEKLFS